MLSACYAPVAPPADTATRVVDLDRADYYNVKCALSPEVAGLAANTEVEFLSVVAPGVGTRGAAVVSPLITGASWAPDSGGILTVLVPPDFPTHANAFRVTDPQHFYAIAWEAPRRTSALNADRASTICTSIERKPAHKVVHGTVVDPCGMPLNTADVSGCGTAGMLIHGGFALGIVEEPPCEIRAIRSDVHPGEVASVWLTKENSDQNVTIRAPWFLMRPSEECVKNAQSEPPSWW